MKRTVAAILLFALLTSFALDSIHYKVNKTAPRVDVNTVSVDEADAYYTLLKNAEYFSDSGVGYSNTMPDVIRAFGNIFARENALELFYKLEAEGNNAGKLYALCGLYYLDYDYYRNLMEVYANNKGTVNICSGCVVMEETMSEVIKMRGAVRLKNNKDTVDAWSRRTLSFDYNMDFYGGSIPAHLMEYWQENKGN
ncbi:MAG: hypothetical protein LBS74_02730 [Oscillospiraceae bacterium]|jgi:hypothetical protein|nr:hypothetical protein [Oscillospiraceae bacterium]